VVIGEKLVLYKALAEGPLNSAELAAKTRTDERYVRAWLASHAARGYITYNEQTRKFNLSEEQAFTFTLANEDSPAYRPGAFQLALGALAAVPRITESFRSGASMGWHEHDEGCIPWLQEILPAKLCSKFYNFVDTFSSESTGQARGRRTRRRRSVPQGSVHRADG
jgi:hypothetical protein